MAHLPPFSGAAVGAQPRTILVVDDEESVRSLLVRWLETTGYVIVAVEGAEPALERLAASGAAVVVCDIRMPGHDGLWLAARVREQHPETAVIMASAVQDVEASRESVRQGALDYLIKPFGRDRLRDAVQHALAWHQAALEARRWREVLERRLSAGTAHVRDAMHAFAVEDDETLDLMFAALTAGAGAAHGHAFRVAATAHATGTRLGMAPATLDVLRRAGLLHDLGKLALPDAVLKKPAPLSADEQVLARRVPRLGAQLLDTVPFLAPAGPIVGAVHERMDALGYPKGIPAATGPLAARVIAVADAFDTMTHPRPFRGAMTRGDAVRELERCAGTQFDAGVVAAFLTTLAFR